jgi:hypothetical protein
MVSSGISIYCPLYDLKLIVVLKGSRTLSISLIILCIFISSVLYASGVVLIFIATCIS